VSASYFSFHLMVALGVAFIALTLLASWLRWRGTLFEHRWLLRVFVIAVIGPVIANEVGWASAEVGRQPWIVVPGVVRDAGGNPALDSAGMVRFKLEEGLLTRDAVSESVKGGEVLASIILFGAIYALLFVVWIYVLNDKIQRGPQPVHAAAHTTAGGVLDVGAERTLHRESMSEAKDPEEEA